MTTNDETAEARRERESAERHAEIDRKCHAGIEGIVHRWLADILVPAVTDGVITAEQRQAIIDHAPGWGHR